MDISVNNVEPTPTPAPSPTPAPTPTPPPPPKTEEGLSISIPENERTAELLREKGDIEQYVKNQMEDIQYMIEDVIEAIGTTPDTTYTVFVRTALIRLLGEWVALNQHPVATPTLPVMSPSNRTMKSPVKKNRQLHIRESLENEIDSVSEKDTILPKIV